MSDEPLYVVVRTLPEAHRTAGIAAADVQLYLCVVFTVLEAVNATSWVANLDYASWMEEHEAVACVMRELDRFDYTPWVLSVESTCGWPRDSGDLHDDDQRIHGGHER